jgi:hypothetical protein
MVRWALSRLRRLIAWPFGLVPSAAAPLPLAFGFEPLKEGIAPHRLAMSLSFGWLYDSAAPLVEVTTHWDGKGWDDPGVPGYQPGAWELGAAEHRDGAVGRGDWEASGRFDGPVPGGPFEHGQLVIAVSGLEQSVPVLRYRHYQAFSFHAGKVVVTVVSRHPPDGMPRFEPVTDLEPFNAGFLAQVKERDG